MIVERLDAAEFPIRRLVDGFEDDRLGQFPDPDRVQRADQAILSGPIDVGTFAPLFWVLDQVDHLIELFEIAAGTLHSIERHRRLRSHREFASKTRRSARGSPHYDRPSRGEGPSDWIGARERPDSRSGTPV